MRAGRLINRLKTDKHFRRSFCALFLAVGLVVTGVSLAYFTSNDSVTNRLQSDAPESEIRVTEPEWDSTGEAKAKRFVAGEEIEKDPYTTSYMSPDVYVRLKISVYAYDSKTGYTEVTLGNGESLKLVEYDTTSAHVDTNNYSAFLSTIYYNDDQLLKSVNNAVTSNNSSYYYEDGYFYYIDSSKSLLKLSYGEKTSAPLFTSVKLPVFDSEYDLFKNGFKIVVTAEAVDVAKFNNAGTSITGDITNIAKVFTDNAADKTFNVYDDDTVTNVFTPGTVSISVKENDKVLTNTENKLTWDSKTTTATKKVQIHCNDTETSYTSCYVRACLVPKWESKIDTTDFEVLDNENIAEDKTNDIEEDGNDIVFPDSIENNSFTIDGVTFKLNSDWSTYWIYKDGYFYYKKVLSPGEDTEPLLESVSMDSDDLKKHTDNGETLGIAVLTDAIQSDGGAVGAVKWADVTVNDSGELELAAGGKSNG